MEGNDGSTSLYITRPNIYLTNLYFNRTICGARARVELARGRGGRGGGRFNGGGGGGRFGGGGGGRYSGGRGGGNRRYDDNDDYRKRYGLSCTVLINFFLNMFYKKFTR